MLLSICILLEILQSQGNSNFMGIEERGKQKQNTEDPYFSQLHTGKCPQDIAVLQVKAVLPHLLCSWWKICKGLKG